ETWNGRTLLRAGRLSEAGAVLEGRFALEDGTHAAAVLDAAGIVALGRLAIHTGDTRQARRLGDIAQVMFDQGTPAVRRHAGWLLAIFAMAKDNAEAARRWLRATADPDGRAILPRFPLDIADEVQLARIARATHDDALAQLALSTSRRRELGVRRRLVTAEPETSGWAALTTSELTVARLVAEGLTNREVAERLFVSPHTVNSHLRHVFSKLGINSRVELARLARNHEMA